jgi:ABC-2 type transport system ATP-binding protein
MEEPCVRFSGVHKSYGGTRALADLNLEIPCGSVFGLLGRNGAGKSTALRTLVGLEGADRGAVRVLGRDPLALDVGARQRIGYLSEGLVPFPDASAASLIRLCAPLYPSWNQVLEDQILVRFQIDPRRSLRQLSLGQQRAVGLLLAICPQPELLILDEPAANLDAVVRREFLEAILGLIGQENRTVIFSSHILSDVERVADRIGILHHGRLLIQRPLDELKEQVRRVRLMFDGSPPEELDLPGVLAVRRAPREALLTVIGYDEEAIEDLARTLRARVEVQSLGLEELFIDLVGDQSPMTWAAA